MKMQTYYTFVWYSFLLTIKDSKFDEEYVHQSPKITFDYIALNMLIVWLLLVILIRIDGSKPYKTASSATYVVSPLSDVCARVYRELNEGHVLTFRCDLYFVTAGPERWFIDVS